MLIVAYDMAVLAVTFNYPIFIGSGGMEFWFLNALLFAAAQSPATSGTAAEQRQLPRARARPRRPLEAMP
jgi:hypothetical protein